MSDKKVVVAFIYQDRRVLLTRRAKNKRIAPGCLHLPGGHVEAGEEASAALKREIQEELGVKVEIGASYESFDYTEEDGSRTTGVAHLARPTEPITSLTSSDDHSECLWASSSELTGLFSGQTDHNLYLAQMGFEALNKIGC